MEESSSILSDMTIWMKYARFLPEKNRRENWKEICDRNAKMHIDKFPHLEKEITEVYEKFVRPKKVLPSMRSAQFAGKPIEVNPARIFNCCTVSLECVEAFSEVMFLLLSGCGVGFSVQKKHINKLPIIQGPIKPSGRQRKKRFLVGDSIEGWADTIKVLLNSYFNGGKEIDFDLRDIRDKGTQLVTSGGRAPGRVPLQKCIANIIGVLETAIEERGRGTKLKPIECHDICCYVADCVLAGGIRRSATISLFSLDDEEMLYAKSGNWWELNPQRARANNSAVFVRGRVRKGDFYKFWEIVKNSGSGEPGIYLTNSPDVLTNPCQPSSATVITSNGISNIGNIEVGDMVWSETGWTQVINKVNSGKKNIKEYFTNAGSFVGTDNHRILCNGTKIEIENADSIDVLRGPDIDSVIHDNRLVMDGLVIGDGAVHRASNNLVLLIIGQDDTDYFDSEVSTLIKEHRPGVGDKLWEVETSVGYEDLPKTYERKIPDRYFYNQTPSEICSFLRGLYSANGSLCGKRVTLKSSSFELIKRVQKMLSYVGIHSYYTTNKSRKTKFKNGTYESKQSYDLNISSDRGRFCKIIGFIQKYKNEKLNTIIKNTQSRDTKTTSDIKEVFDLGDEEVFDITVDNKTHTYWSEGLNVSNCGEISICSENMCNLTEINASNIGSQQDFNERAAAATILGTLQATYTDFHYLRDTWKENVERDALLGVSMTGIASNKVTYLDMAEASRVCVETNKEWAGKLGINTAKRITTGKPSGTTSCVLGCSSGVHSWHAPYYIRRIRVNKDEAIYPYIKRRLPELVEDESFSPNSTAVISLPQKADRKSIVRNKESAIELLERVKIIYNEWILGGHIDGSNTHNQSVTVSIKDNEWDDVRDWMWENRDSYSGISVLPYDGGTYIQAPFEECSRGDYEKMIPLLRSINIDSIKESRDETNLSGEMACSGGSCELL